jgi:hypothetical protein
MVLGAAVSGDALLGSYAFLRGGQCGRASLLPAPSYHLRMVDYGIVLPGWCCPVPSLSSRWWPLSMGVKPSGPDI